MREDAIRTAYPGIAFARNYWKCWKCQTPLQPWQNEGDEFICSVDTCDGKLTPGGIVPIDEVCKQACEDRLTQGSGEGIWWKWVKK